jgi:hypothetical protein
MRQAIFFALIAMTIFQGCSSQPAQVQVPQTSTAPVTKSIPNADYECWKQFPLGTRVVRRKTMSNSNGATTVTTSLQLKELEPSSATVESQVTVVRPTETTENPAEMLTIASAHKIPEEMNPELFRLPSPDAKLLRSELIQVKGKAYDAAVYRWKATLESGPVDVTGWFCDGFPARQIRLEFDYTDDTTGIDEVIDLEIPASNSEG